MLAWFRKKSLFVQVVCTGLALTMALQAAPPDWWQTRRVLVPTAPAQDFGIVNQGQVKHLAHAAYRQMQAELPGGAGTELTALMANWLEPAASVNDFAPVTVGQLKNLAKPFFDRLVLAGLAQGYSWSVFTEDDEDFAPANVGQAKQLFSFVLPMGHSVPDPKPGQVWAGSEPGSNSPGTYLPPNPAVNLSRGTAADKSLFNFARPRQNGGTGDVVVPMTMLQYVSFSDTYRTHDGATTANNNNPPSYTYHRWDLGRSGLGHSTTYSDSDFYPPSFELGPSGVWTALTVMSYHFPSLERYIYNPADLSDHPEYIGRLYDEERWDSEAGKAWVQLSGALNRWQYFYYNKEKVTSNGVDPPHIVPLGRVRFAIPSGDLEPPEGQREPLEPARAETLSEGTAETVRLVEAAAASGEPTPGFRISASDAAGPSYRKIGLNGAPVPDSKPQVKDESGERPEETFIDAFTRQLRHSSSDVYVSLESSLITLTVRRDVAPEAWTLRRGLRPSERPDRPFGPGWSSNLCAHVRIEDSFRKAIITDEQGQSATFIRQPVPEGHPDPFAHIWRHSREEKEDAKTASDTLETVFDENGQASGFLYRKKYGTRCLFELTALVQGWSADRVDGSHKDLYTQYARLINVHDRWANSLVYSYDSATTLIPYLIQDPVRPVHKVSITQNEGRVTAVRGPAGDTTTYGYTTVGAAEHSCQCLASVTRGGGSVGYGYEMVVESPPPGDLDPAGPPDPGYRHLSLVRITDERNHDYQFDYEFNHDCKYVEVSGNAFATRSQLGMPRMVREVELPDGATIDVGGVRNIVAAADGEIVAAGVQTTVSGGCGTYVYTFDQPSIFRPLAPDPWTEDWLSRSLTVAFSRMRIQSPAGTETYLFSFDHGMALKSATDSSGNSTVFEYPAVGSNGLGWDDPLRQTNALGKVRHFTYDSELRILSSITDERGVLTSYDIAAGTGLRTAETISQSGEVLRRTEFAHHPGFAGFVTQVKVISGGPAMPDAVTDYYPDSNGRVAEQIVRAAPGVNLVTSYRYSGNGSKVSETDPRGNTTAFTYDPVSLRLTEVNHADGSASKMGYDPHGNVVWRKDETGVLSLYEYDVLNRCTRKGVDLVGDGVMSARSTGYVFIPGEKVPRYNGDVVNETTYNAFNLPVLEADPRGVVTRHEYDAAGRRTQTTVNYGGASPQVTQWFYNGTNIGGSVFDVSGYKPVKSVNPRGFQTQYTYDKLYRLTGSKLTDTSVSPSQIVTTANEYDETGNLLKTTDPAGRVTRTEYDGLGRATLVRLPPDRSGPGGISATRSSFYTPSGQVWKTVDELGRESLAYFDGAGRVVRSLQPEVDDGSGVRVVPETLTAYDGCGNAIAVRDPLGRITHTEHDARNRPVFVRSPYVWDALSNSWQRPVSGTAYDAAGRVISQTNPLGHTTDALYDAAGRAAATVFPPVPVYGLGLVESFKCSCLDANGNVVASIDERQRLTTNVYDAFNRLVSTIDPLLHETSFGYDAANNRTSVKDAKLQTTTFAYDAQGRVVREVHPGNQTNTSTYGPVYLISTLDAAGKTSTHSYDGRGWLKTRQGFNGAGTKTNERSFT